MSSESEEQGYSPEVSNEGEQAQNCGKFRGRVGNQDKASVEGKWSQDENIKYAIFMDFHSAVFASKERRKSTRIFKSLSAFLETRTPRQCRSHFQKIMNKFKKVNKVRQHFQQLIGQVQYQRRYEQLTDRLKDSVILGEADQGSADAGIQTDPLLVQLGDLPNHELIRLMNLMNEYYRCQIPVFVNPIKMEENGPNIFQIGGMTKKDE